MTPNKPEDFILEENDWSKTFFWVHDNSVYLSFAMEGGVDNVILDKEQVNKLHNWFGELKNYLDRDNQQDGSL